MTTMHGIVVLIPAYKPSPALVKVVGDLFALGLQQVLVVDDGSPPEFAPIFDRVRRLGARTLAHATNRGKGAALKTGMMALRQEFPDVSGVVCCDADGQHLAVDVLKVAETLARQPHALILGSRQFDRRLVPLRSHLGNQLTRAFFFALTGCWLADTQTGLRGIPTDYWPQFIALRPEGYDFETDMLVTACRDRMPIVEVPITTVYEQGNASSHFNPVFDSLKIYFVFLRFVLASLLSAVIDTTTFIVVHFLSNHILLSMVTARLTAGVINFGLSRRFTFKSKEPMPPQMLRYWALFTAYLVFTYGVVEALAAASVNVYAAKLAIEAVMFVFSFVLQNAYVFRAQRRQTAEVSDEASPPERDVAGW